MSKRHDIGGTRAGRASIPQQPEPNDNPQNPTEKPQHVPVMNSQSATASTNATPGPSGHHKPVLELPHLPSGHSNPVPELPVAAVAAATQQAPDTQFSLARQQPERSLAEQLLAERLLAEQLLREERSMILQLLEDLLYYRYQQGFPWRFAASKRELLADISHAAINIAREYGPSLLLTRQAIESTLLEMTQRPFGTRRQRSNDRPPNV